MPRNPLFDQFSRAIRIAWFAERMKISTSDALERAAEARAKRSGAARGASFLVTWCASLRRARSRRSPARLTPPSRSRATEAAASPSWARAWRALRAPIA